MTKEQIINFIDDKPMGKKAQKALLRTREARIEARKLARSGHPGRRADGIRGVADTTSFLRTIVHRDFMERTGR